MRLYEYLKDNELFDSTGTYPEYVTSDIKSAVADIALYDYGQRKIRPYLEFLAEPREGEVTPTLETVVTSAVYSFCVRYAYKFTGLFESEGYDYDPIENYNMREEMTNDETVIEYGKVDTRVLDKDSSDTRTYDVTDTHTLNSLTNTETGQIEGFNSSSFQDSNKNTSVGTGSEDTAKTGTDTMVYSGSDTDTNTQSGSDTHTRNYLLTRTGNIGITTSQMMIQSERDLRNFSALQEFAHGIINEISIGVY